MNYAVLNAQAESLDWIPVNSSNVQAVAYSEPFYRMFVRFKSGALYAYDEVGPTTYSSFHIASSKGHWVWAVLRNYGKDNVFPYRGPL